MRIVYFQPNPAARVARVCAHVVRAGYVDESHWSRVANVTDGVTGAERLQADRESFRAARRRRLGGLVLA